MSVEVSVANVLGHADNLRRVYDEHFVVMTAHWWLGACVGPSLDREDLVHFAEFLHIFSTFFNIFLQIFVQFFAHFCTVLNI